MGNWVINIEGHGMHDNGKDQDIDDLLKFFVNELRTIGQDVFHVTLSVGAVRNLVDKDWKFQ